MFFQKWGLQEVVPRNTMSVLWTIPQYLLISIGEVMFAVTGLQIPYSQAPTSMKTFVQACWNLTMSFGNLMIVIFEQSFRINKQSIIFTIYALVLLLDICIFFTISVHYHYLTERQHFELLYVDGHMSRTSSIALGNIS